MATLTTQAILNVIDICQAVSATDTMRQVAEKVIEEVKVEQLSVSTTDEAVQQIRMVVEQFRMLITDDAYERLTRTHLYVIPKPLCNAYAYPEQNAIVVFAGLLETLIYRMNVYLAIAEVKKYLEHEGQVQDVSIKTFNDIAFKAMSLSLHFLATPEPLPLILNDLSEGLREQSYVGLCGGLLYIVLHELGHLTLGHGVNRDTPTALPTLAFYEDVNQYKQQEFEADRFALEAFTPQARAAFMPNIWYVMNFYMDYEALVGGFKNRHPLAINRIANLLNDPEVLSDPSIANSSRTMFTERLRIVKERYEMDEGRIAELPATQQRAIREKSIFQALNSVSEGHVALRQLLSLYKESRKR